MEAAIPFFTGSDYDVHPHDFLRLFRRVERTDDIRIQQFVNYLQAGSVADEWWDGLGDDVKSSWGLVEVEFGRRWPMVPLARKTSARCLEEMLAMKLPSSVLGMTERYSARVVYSHVGWASRMMELARGAGIMGSGAYLGNVIRSLPWPVRQLVRGKYETWGAFLEGVRALEVEVLEDWMEVGKRRGRVPVAGKHRSTQTRDRSLPTSVLQARAQDWRTRSPVGPQDEDCSPTPAPVFIPASEATRHWVPESLPGIPNNGDENVAAVRSSEGDSRPVVVADQLPEGGDEVLGDSGFEMPGAWRDGDGRCGKLIDRVVTRTQASLKDLRRAKADKNEDPDLDDEECPVRLLQKEISERTYTLFEGRVIRRTAQSKGRTGEPLINLPEMTIVPALLRLTERELDIIDAITEPNLDAAASANSRSISSGRFYIEHRLSVTFAQLPEDSKKKKPVFQSLAEWNAVKSTKIDVCARLIQYLLMDDDTPPVDFVNGEPVFPVLPPTDPSNPPKQESKIIVFQEFSSFRSLVQNILTLYGINSVYISGRCNYERRASMIVKFKTDPTCRVLLFSKVGNVGLNLTCANTVIFLDQPWSASDERQIRGRIHRQGQQRACTSYQLLALDTADVVLSGISESKSEMFEAFFSREASKRLASVLRGGLMPDTGDEPDSTSGLNVATSSSTSAAVVQPPAPIASSSSQREDESVVPLAPGSISTSASTASAPVQSSASTASSRRKGAPKAKPGLPPPDAPSTASASTASSKPNHALASKSAHPAETSSTASAPVQNSASTASSRRKDALKAKSALPADTSSTASAPVQNSASTASSRRKDAVKAKSALPADTSSTASAPVQNSASTASSRRKDAVKAKSALPADTSSTASAPAQNSASTASSKPKDALKVKSALPAASPSAPVQQSASTASSKSKPKPKPVHKSKPALPLDEQSAPVDDPASDASSDAGQPAAEDAVRVEGPMALDQSYDSMYASSDEENVAAFLGGGDAVDATMLSDNGSSVGDSMVVADGSDLDADEEGRGPNASRSSLFSAEEGDEAPVTDLKRPFPATAGKGGAKKALETPVSPARRPPAPKRFRSGSRTAADVNASPPSPTGLIQRSASSKENEPSGSGGPSGSSLKASIFHRKAATFTPSQKAGSSRLPVKPINASAANPFKRK